MLTITNYSHIFIYFLMLHFRNYILSLVLLHSFTRSIILEHHHDELFVSPVLYK